MPRFEVLFVVHQPEAGPGVFADVVAASGAASTTWDTASGAPPPRDPADVGAAIVLGGAMQVDETADHPWLDTVRDHMRGLLAAEVPVLGICLGAQLLAEAAGGSAGPAPRPEVGWNTLEVLPGLDDDPILSGLAEPVFQCHSYACELPPGATPLARTDVCVQAFRVGTTAWGLQWHPEPARADLFGWLDSGIMRSVDPSVDEAALRRESEGRIAAYEEAGRRLCRRFVDHARDLV
jgi:GMP synthase-like glutamine amidotransferase